MRAMRMHLVVLLPSSRSVAVWCAALLIIGIRSGVDVPCSCGHAKIRSFHVLMIRRSAIHAHLYTFCAYKQSGLLSKRSQSGGEY